MLPAKKTDTLYERLGGKEAVTVVVDEFYKRVLSDEKLKRFFNETNMEKQRRMQTTFLTYAFGGDVEYRGRSMEKAHEKARREGLTEEHFNLVANHLVDTLKHFKVKQADIDDVVKVALSVKEDIVGKASATSSAD